jgi:hypothetical protein
LAFYNNYSKPTANPISNSLHLVAARRQQSANRGHFRRQGRRDSASSVSLGRGERAGLAQLAHRLAPACGGAGGVTRRLCLLFVFVGERI